MTLQLGGFIQGFGALRNESLNSQKEEAVKFFVRFCLTVVIVFLLVSVSQAQTATHSGPFGFSYGETKAQVIKEVGTSHVKVVDDYSLAVDTAPKPHNLFEEYDLFFSPTKGLLKIIAISKDIGTNSSGEQLKGSFNDMKAALSGKYGQEKFVLDTLAEVGDVTEALSSLEADGEVTKDEKTGIWTYCPPSTIELFKEALSKPEPYTPHTD